MSWKRKPDGRSYLLPLLAAGSLVVAACGDGPTAPGEDVNPALVELANGGGFASGGQSLPQGSATFAGPGAIPMDATGVEFIQQLTLRSGAVLRTSGVQFFAVPVVGTVDPPFDRMAAFAAMTGSLSSVSPGTYPISEYPDDVDYITEIPAHGAWIGRGEYKTQEQHWADTGTFTIASLDYFPDVYPCEEVPSWYDVDVCEYQIGVVSGIVEFRVSMPDGSEIVQQQRAFSVPIRRATIVARQR